MKSIIFNTEMVKAVLDGRKAQFRIPIKLKDNSLVCTGYIFSSTDRKRNSCYSFGKNKECDMEYIKSKYKVDDILYVKETFTLGEKQIIKPENVWYIRNDLGNEVFYKADLNDNFYDPDFICKWKPSVHLKQKDARISLKVTNVRVERLDNYGLDVREEGIREDGFYTFSVDSERERKRLFIQLWNSTAKDGYKWEDNPYVFVYEFERINKED